MGKRRGEIRGKKGCAVMCGVFGEGCVWRGEGVSPNGARERCWSALAGQGLVRDGWQGGCFVAWRVCAVRVE